MINMLIAAIAAGVGGPNPLNIEARTYSDTQLFPTDGHCLIGFNNNGFMQLLQGNGPTPSSDEWWRYQPQADIGDNYHIRLNTTSQTGNFNHASTEAADVWLALTVARDFGYSVTGVGFPTWSGVVELSLDGGSTIKYTSPTITIKVTVDT